MQISSRWVKELWTYSSIVNIRHCYYEKANDEVVEIAMIETKEGLHNIEEIASVEGLNGFYIGTSGTHLC